jgi:cob(I)alamin adenosyltransferase
MSISTRTGDQGSTGLLYGQRVPKDHPQIEAVGSFDELNAALGIAKASCTDAVLRAELESIQMELVSLMGEIVCAEADAERYAASKFQKITEESLTRIDAGVATLESRKLSFHGWATPGATPHAASLDFARTVARRAERQLISLPAHGKTIRPLLLCYVNRLCDLLWLMARAAEQS